MTTAPPGIPGARSPEHGRAHLAAPHNEKSPAQDSGNSPETPLSLEPGGTSCPKSPGVPKEPKPAKRIRFSPGDAGATFQGKVNVQKAIRTTAPQAAKFNATIKTNLDTWSADTDKAATHYSNIINLESQLEQEYGALGTVLVAVGLDRSAFITSVEAVITSEADAKALGGNAIIPGKHVEPVSPVHLPPIDTAVAGANRIRWLSEQGAASYMAEASTVGIPPTAASWATCYMGMSPFFVYTGAPAQKVWFRVCSVGKAPAVWSAPFLITLR